MSRTQPAGSSVSADPATSASGQRQENLYEPDLGSVSEATAWEAAVDLIHHSANILLICHVSPDGDAIGSLLGLGLGLNLLGKNTTLACESTVPRKFSFLPDFDSIVNALDSHAFDLVIGLDSSDPTRLGTVYDSDRLAKIPLINIDHHVTNLFFGDIDLVDSSAASTAEMVITLLDRLGVSIDQDTAVNSSPRQEPEIATCLLTGIVTDTLGFRTSNVTPKVMKAAMRLMEAGASLCQVTHYAFNQRPVTELNLLASGLNRMRTDDGLAWSEITLADRHSCGHKGNGDAGLVGMLVRTREIHIAAVFTEKDDHQVEIGFRADPGFDVAQLALSLGGGGHPAASGCTIEGPLEAAKARVLPLLRATLEVQKSKGA